MIRNNPSTHSSIPSIGISAISSFQPEWLLPNDWFDSIPRKFVKHTGIKQRSVAQESEIALALHAIENLVENTGCDLGQCAGLVFTSPSFVPPSVARRYLSEEAATKEQLSFAVNKIVDSLEIWPRRVLAVNTFCAGYATSLAIIKNIFLPTIHLQSDEFILVLTSSRISRITDYSCRQTAALFGDLATATLVSRTDSVEYPVHFELMDVVVGKRATPRPFFDFLLGHQIPAPTSDGGTRLENQRIVFSMDGMGIADTAPRAMAESATSMLNRVGWQPQDIRFIVPHQAGLGIVRLAEMKLRQAGFTAEVVNGMTGDVGNISSGSVPHTLEQKWNGLAGDILCPIASVGPPGKPAVAQGCIALRSTPLHQSSPH